MTSAGIPSKRSMKLAAKLWSELHIKSWYDLNGDDQRKWGHAIDKVLKEENESN